MSDSPVNLTRLKKFKKEITTILSKELQLRADIKKLYEQFSLDVSDDRLSLRYLRQTYFQAQKERMAILNKEKLEFHPFFTSLIPLEEEENDNTE